MTTSPRIDFSGHWVLDLAQSRLQIPPPDTSTLDIEQRDPDFHLRRTHVLGSRRDEMELRLKADGKERPIELAGVPVRACLSWYGAELLVVMTIDLRGQTGTNTVRYAISADGRTLTATEQVRAPGMEHDNVWVFSKA